ncbi:shikimate kinase [Deinococcus multiflagellatus]|uniref:Shikimate kinase n=1 Tax=Deinococcus multiflagellatus TaxID=1656887 RepID=A0ABW1ZF26_9DEIO|nr:shikimate kinase [Deinococcus multiflagellatus]
MFSDAAGEPPPTDRPARLEWALSTELRGPGPAPEGAPVTPPAEDCRTLSPMFSSGLIERPVSWVALAGFMGTGKSRIGWELSRALALHFVDTDKLITRVVGKSIPEVFAQEGEGYFRACEHEVVRRVTRLEHAVISLGGGTFINEDNRHELLERGPVVVLWASPETVYQRTKHSDRPLLRAEDPLSKIRTLMHEREPVYRQGTIHVHSDGRPSEEIVEEIIERLWAWADVQQAWADAGPERPELGERAAD